VRAVIRKIYGWNLDWTWKHPYHYWVKIARAADKYLEPDLVASACSNIASYRFRRAGSTGHDCDPEGCDVEGTCEILYALREFDSNEEVLNSAYRLARVLQKRHVRDSDHFRSCLCDNPKVMLRLLEESSEHPRTVHTGMDVCDHHLEMYFTRTEPGDPCQWCDHDERPTQRYNMWHVRCG
jgi:hypothetical protein